jgi:hypothetical protein
MSQDLQDDLTPSEGAEGIAVVGMAGRFPGAARHKAGRKRCPSGPERRP